MLKLKDEHKGLVLLAKNARPLGNINIVLVYDMDKERYNLIRLTALFEQGDFVKYKFDNEEYADVKNNNQNINIDKYFEKIKL